MGIMDGGMVAIGSPAFIDAFDTDASVIVWITLAYYLGSTAPILTLGWVADTIGRKRMYLWGSVAVCASLALSALAQDVTQLIITRVVMAVGTSMMLANDNALLTQGFPTHERGKAQGINNMALGLGIGFGFLLGGLLVDTLGWRALFWSRLPAQLLVTFLVWRYIKDDPTGRLGRVEIDYIGSILLTIVMVTGLIAINQGGKLDIELLLVMSLGISTVGFLLILFVVERQAANPIIELDLFASRVFSSGVMAQLFVQIAHGGWNFLAPFYLIHGIGFSASFAGFLILPFHLVRVILSPVSGAISDNLGTLLPSLLGKIILLGGLLALSQLGLDSPTWQIGLVIGLGGAGLSIFLPANNSAIMGYVPQTYLSSASGFLATSRSIGTAIGTALAAALYANALGGAGLPSTGIASPAVIGAFNDGITVVTLTSALGILAILWRGRD